MLISEFAKLVLHAKFGSFPGSPEENTSNYNEKYLQDANMIVIVDIVSCNNCFAFVTYSISSETIKDEKNII